MNAIEKQTIDILAKLNENNKSFVLDFAKFIEQKQSSENMSHIDKAISEAEEEFESGDYKLYDSTKEMFKDILAEDEDEI